MQFKSSGGTIWPIMRSTETMSGVLPRNVISMETWKANHAPIVRPKITEQTPSIKPPYFPDVPMEREEFRNDERFSVVRHELNHAKLALKLRKKVILLSANPSGVVLGHTIIGGNVDPESMQIVAAGGSHKTSSGGDGSDRMKVIALQPYGKSAETAHKLSEKLLANDDEKVDIKAAEIILFLGGAVDGDTLNKVYIRATWEVWNEAHDTGLISGDFIPSINSELIHEPQQITTQITYIKDGRTLYTYYDGDGLKINDKRVFENVTESPASLPHPSRRGVMIDPLAA